MLTLKMLPRNKIVAIFENTESDQNKLPKLLFYPHFDLLSNIPANNLSIHFEKPCLRHWTFEMIHGNSGSQFSEIENWIKILKLMFFIEISLN